MVAASTGSSRLLRALALGVGLSIGVGALGAALAAWWLRSPLALAGAQVELSIEPGTSPRDVAEAWVNAGVQTSPILLYQWFRWSGQARRIRAGSYEIEPGITPRQLLAKMVQGDEALERVRIGEGWTLRQVRQALAAAPNLKPRSAGLDPEALLPAIGAAGGAAEGQFFPDTYVYSRGVSDLTVLARAHAAMQRRLQAAWEGRRPDHPARSPQELLVLASIVEKETGPKDDPALVAAVFVNRLKRGMPLQSDPTVIYGLGEAFDGNLRKRDLQTDGPFNTYTRAGLPPTPIALPGQDALDAAAKPAPSQALYFVARGDGSSVFSEKLADHNRAVNQYQRGRRP
jgi:UPF0755 protein